MSTENVVADSWEDADADPGKGLADKMEQVKIDQRKEQKKEAFFEKVKAEENGILPKLQVEEGNAQSAEEPKRVVLLRPKDGFASETVVVSPPSAATEQHQSRGRSHQKQHQKEPKQPTQTFEERQAAYQAARERIMGPEYVPDNHEIKEIKFIDRSKSPETLRMTEQNMVEHYGEELSRELMQQPTEPAGTPQHFVPDFSQPPPSIVSHDGSDMYNGPPGFQNHQNFQQSHPQQFIDNAFYQMNGHMQMQYANQQCYQQYGQQENSTMSSSSQNSVADGQNEHQQTVYYNYPPQPPQQMIRNFVPFNLPNMAYPPPNFTPQGQQPSPPQQMQQPQQQQQQQHQVQQSNQQMMPNSLLMMPAQQAAQQAAQQQMMAQYQNQMMAQNGQNRGAPPAVRGGAVNNGFGRGQARQQLMYMPTGAQTNQQPPPLMYQNPNGQQQNNGQSFGGRNGSGNMQQQRQFQPIQQSHQNGQFYQNSNQNHQNNGRKQHKNGRNGGNDMQKMMSNVPMNVGSGNQNPIPFGCPPRHVNAIREQYANPGAGLLGPHPLMASQWNGPPPTRPH